LSAWGKKLHPQKNAGFENESNSRGKTENQDWHVSCIRDFHGKFLQGTSDLLRAISRSAHGVNAAGCFDLQLTCQ
jgi:hypothetical protein